MVFPSKSVVVFTSLQLLIAGISTAQLSYPPDKIKQYDITVNGEENTVKTSVMTRSDQVSSRIDRTYLWYYDRKVFETVGGFSGKLLHGAYSSFYLSNQLKERGQVHRGLKTGEWVYWYPDGKLKEVINWKSGRKKGAYRLYNDEGKLIARGRFRNDKLHGVLYTYSSLGKLIERKRFRNGNAVIASDKKAETAKRKKTENEQEISSGRKDTGKKDLKGKKPGWFQKLFRKKENHSPNDKKSEQEFKTVHS